MSLETIVASAPRAIESVIERLEGALKLIEQAKKISDEAGLDLEGNKLSPFLQIPGIEQVLLLVKQK
tara:strand:+ start:275 stop:475 length:201 start_codon:yes stop_codon:yes gene_type:complete